MCYCSVASLTSKKKKARILKQSNFSSLPHLVMINDLLHFLAIIIRL